MKERDGRRLTVRLLREESGLVLLLEEEYLRVPLDEVVARGFTRREAEVLWWVTDGKTNPEIAIILGLSERTVQHSLERVYRKLGVETRTAAAARALELVREAKLEDRLSRIGHQVSSTGSDGTASPTTRRGLAK